MVNAMIGELELQRHYLKDEVVDTIYFGGGTPSILESSELGRLLTFIKQNFKIGRAPEITLETNPDDLTMKKLQELKTLGINRLSIGIQSFNDRILSYLHRAHNAAQAISCINHARIAGFKNLSIDLIFSIPNQTITDVEKDIERALDLNPEHISVYSLTIEEKTVFGNWHRKDRFRQVSDEFSARQFELIIDRLESGGYEQYEISNFCRDGNYSRHNSSYWKNVNYLGIGPGAHSYNGKTRQFNIPNNHKYMKSIKQGIIPSEIENLDIKSRANEFLLTSLRTKWGCDLAILNTDFNYNIKQYRHENLQKFMKNELIFVKGGTIYLTRKGKFLADDIIADLFWI